MGGFTTTAARLARSNIRPLLLLPPTSNPSASASLLKRIYDLSGIILTILILNYCTSPFVLLTTSSDSLLIWSRLGWYGHIVVLGSLAFFYGGGTKFFMSLQKARGILPPGKVAAATAVSVQNGASMPVSEKTFMFPPLADAVVPPLSWSSKKKNKSRKYMQVATPPASQWSWPWISPIHSTYVSAVCTSPYVESICLGDFTQKKSFFG